MSELREQEIIAAYLKEYGLEHAFLERLTSRVFYADYPEIIPGSPGGGGDEGMDLMHVSIDGTLTAWCITAEKPPRDKLLRDARRVLGSFTDWDFNTLGRVYLCTCRKLSNRDWQEMMQTFCNERDLLAKTQPAVSKADVSKVDCDYLALRLTSEPTLAGVKEEIMELIRAGIGLPADSLVASLSSALPEKDEAGDELAHIQDESEPTDEKWTIPLEQLRRDYAGIDSGASEDRVLACVALINRFVIATKMMNHQQRSLLLPQIRKELNEQLWPEISAAYTSRSTPPRVSCLLMLSFHYTNLALLSRAEISLHDAPALAARFLLDIPADQLPRHLVVFKLTARLAWLLHRASEYEEVMRLLLFSQNVLFRDMHQHAAFEEERLSISLATLHIHAARYREGPRDYRTVLETMFNQCVKVIQDGFWRAALPLLNVLHSRNRNTNWAVTRERYLQHLEKIPLRNVNTPEKAIAYLHLRGAAQSLAGITGLVANHERVKILEDLPKKIQKHPVLRIRRLLLEFDAAHLASPRNLPKHFHRAEELITQNLRWLQGPRGRMLKLRFLRLFLMRVFNPEIIEGEDFASKSSVVIGLLNSGRAKVVETYFGIDGAALPQVRQSDDEGLFEQLKPLLRPLVTACLSCYANTVLPNSAIHPGVRASAALDYLDFLTLSEARFGGAQVAAVFYDTLRILEARAAEAPLFHYYLARLYYRHTQRDVPKALHHFRQFWPTASDLEKSRTANEYARTLYEYYIYTEDQAGTRESLDTLLAVCREFLDSENIRYFISCYYGLALVLDDVSAASGETERLFLAGLGKTLPTLGSSRPSSLSRRERERLFPSIIYTNKFHDFVSVNSASSYIAASILASLDSPEIYNALGTYLVHSISHSGDMSLLPCAKMLYDIAIGLASNTEFYQPKYEFNRLRCDFVEIQVGGAPKTTGDVDSLAATITQLHRLSWRFVWAYRFLQKDVCEYLFSHRTDPMVLRLLDRPQRWPVLRSAFRHMVSRAEEHDETPHQIATKVREYL